MAEKVYLFAGRRRLYGANICLRQLAEIKADPVWVICLKETTAVAIVGPWLLWQFGRGVRFSCHPRALLVLGVAALSVQLIGNLGIQWSLGIVGLVISLPMVFRNFADRQCRNRSVCLSRALRQAFDGGGRRGIRFDCPVKRGSDGAE